MIKGGSTTCRYKITAFLLLTSIIWILFSCTATTSDDGEFPRPDFFEADIKIMRIFDETSDSFGRTFTMTACEIEWLEECFNRYDPFFSEYRNRHSLIIDDRDLPDIGVVEGAVVRVTIREMLWLFGQPAHLEIYHWELISRPPRNWRPLIISISAVVLIGLGGHLFNKKYEIQVSKRVEELRNDES